MKNQPYGPPDSYPIPKFWEPNYWEPSVQLALRDYCRPGDTVFDVGANAGGLSLVMSRLVGPRGIVCAFEASPRIVDKTLHNLVTGGCTNVQVYCRAIHQTSRQIVTLYAGKMLNDSLHNTSGTPDGETFQVETLALDDFVAASGLTPKLIKMDIEGAEFDALCGASDLLLTTKPLLILEQSPDDMRCHALLTAMGYTAVDLATLRIIRKAEDCPRGIANVLFVHDSQADHDPYVNAGDAIERARLVADDFVIDARGTTIQLAQPLELPAGRYLCRANFTASGTDNQIYAGIAADGTKLVRYQANSAYLADYYRDWVFALSKAGRVTPYLELLHGSDPTLRWHGAVLYRFPGFDRIQAPVVF